jgi:ABC-type transport system involved in multi-copper enzyme maturation permease subunit
MEPAQREATRGDGPLARLTQHPAANAAGSPSAVRAWCYLVLLSWQRQARVRQMVWIALALLGFSVVLVGLNTLAGRWGMNHWRGPRTSGESWQDWNKRPTYRDWADNLAALRGTMALSPNVTEAVSGVYAVVLDRSDFLVFSRVAVFTVFLSFLLPLWSLSFATESFGSEREGSSMLWLLTRPLPRPAIYLAKFVALLPWSLGLNLGGFALLCLAAGRPGPLALRLFWPAVLCGTLAFAALFQLIGAFFTRAAIIAVVYSFFLETILGNMPGYMKRLSISFYARCMMFDAAELQGLQPEKPSMYLPVDGSTALWVLLITTVVLVLLGTAIFSRTEYREAAI